MSYSTVCNAEESGRLKGTASASKSQSGAVKELFWSPESFAFANKADAIDQDVWNTEVGNGNLWYIGVVEEFDSNDTEATYYESPNGDLRLKTAEAKRVKQYRLVECACKHAALLSFDAQNGRLFFRTAKNYLKARMEKDGTVRGFKTNQFDVGILQDATTEAPAFTPIDVTYANPVDDDKDVFEDVLDFTFDQVDQIFNAEMSISNVVAGASLNFDVLLTKDCSSAALTGAALANFKATDANGAELTITSVTAGAPANSYAFVVDTTDTVCYIELDGVQTIDDINYVSELEKAST